MVITIGRRAGTLLVGIGAMLAVVALSASSCSNNAPTSAGQAQEAAQSGSIERTFVQNQPVPIFNHSDIRATGIAIEAIQALGENTTSFAIANNGNLIWSCPSLGEPFHADDQITNPQAVYDDPYPNGGASDILGNMDPNGIYAGPNAGTYVLCVNSQGVPYAHYAEELVDVVSGPAVWNPNLNGPGKGGPQLVGAPTMPSCVKGRVNGKLATVCHK